MADTKRVLVLLAPGTEEMEFTISVDVLRRAGAEVCVAGVKGAGSVTCSRGVVITPDTDLTSIMGGIQKKPYDAIVLPGGLEGANAFAESPEVKKLLEVHEHFGRVIAAICAAPVALKKQGLKGRKITSYPSLKKEFEGSDFTYVNEKVVETDNWITSQGPATAFDFAIALVKCLFCKDKADKVAAGLLL